MAVTKLPSGNYRIEFECGGRRYREVVEAANDREARRLVKEAKAAKKTALATVKKITRNSGDAPLDIDSAFARYYRERVGRNIEESTDGLQNDQVQIRDSLIGMRSYFAGCSPPIASLLAINNEAVAGLVRWRSAQYRWGKPEHGFVSARQVNATTVKRLRAVFTRARKFWLLDIPHEPRWNELLVKQPGQRKRILRDTEHVTIQDELAEGYDKLLEFAIASCLRKKESLLMWSDYDPQRRVVTLRIKGGNIIDHPLTPKASAIIESCRGDHPTNVFTYVAQRTQPHKGLVRGQRYPITMSGLTAMFGRAKDRAGLIGYKWHDHRRTGASEINRVHGPKMAQEALHHNDIRTTMSYIVVTHDEVRAAMTDADNARDARIAATRQLMQEQAPKLLPAPQKKRG